MEIIIYECVKQPTHLLQVFKKILFLLKICLMISSLQGVTFTYVKNGGLLSRQILEDTKIYHQEDTRRTYYSIFKQEY